MKKTIVAVHFILFLCVVALSAQQSQTPSEKALDRYVKMTGLITGYHQKYRDVMDKDPAFAALKKKLGKIDQIKDEKEKALKLAAFNKESGPEFEAAEKKTGLAKMRNDLAKGILLSPKEVFKIQQQILLYKGSASFLNSESLIRPNTCILDKSTTFEVTDFITENISFPVLVQGTDWGINSGTVVPDIGIQHNKFQSGLTMNGPGWFQNFHQSILRFKTPEKSCSNLVIDAKMSVMISKSGADGGMDASAHALIRLKEFPSTIGGSATELYLEVVGLVLETRQCPQCDPTVSDQININKRFALKQQ